jgi:hypothetical protein
VSLFPLIWLNPIEPACVPPQTEDPCFFDPNVGFVADPEGHPDYIMTPESMCGSGYDEDCANIDGTSAGIYQDGYYGEFLV